MSDDHARPRVLPANPDLEHLKNEARERLVRLRASAPGAQLAEAQFQIARDYGFASWRALKDEVEGRGGALAAYAGFYRHDTEKVVNSYHAVTQSGAGLTVRHISGMQYSLLPCGDGRFTAPGMPAVHGFEKDESGRIRAMTIDDMDRHERLVRIDAATVREIDAANARAREELRHPKLAVAVATDILERHVGYYASTAGGLAMEATRQDATLYLRIAGAPRLILSAESQNAFFYAHAPAGPRFSFRTEGDKTVALVMHESGVEHLLPRVSAEVAAQASARVLGRAHEQQQPRQAVSIPAELLGRYAGRYRINDQREVIVTAEAGKLFAQFTSQPNRFEVFPESQTKFFWTMMAAQIEFYPDPDQCVRHAVFHSMGRLVPLTRVEEEAAV